MRWPDFATASKELERHGDNDIDTLLSNYKTLYCYLGGDATKVKREWKRGLEIFVVRDEQG